MRRQARFDIQRDDNTSKNQSIVKILEGISVVCLGVPYFMVMTGLGLEHAMFFFFPLGLFLLLPCGVFALAIQKFKQLRHQPRNTIIVNMGLFTMCAGIVGWLVIYLAVGG